MSGHHQWALQQALYAKITGTAAITSLLASTASVYEHVPQEPEPAFPYIEIGDPTVVSWDDKSCEGQTSDVQIAVWSQYQGNKEIRQIQAALHDALHRSLLTVTGAGVVEQRITFETIRRAQDGLTRQGIQRLTVQAVEAA